MINGVIKRWQTIDDNMRNQHVLKNKEPGICSICGMFNQIRDQNARGIECQCSQKWFQENGFGPKLIFDKHAQCKQHKNCQIIFYNTNKNKFECWECYKEKFKHNNTNINFLKQIQEYYSNAFIQLTFRKQEYEDWSGSKQAFEQNLIEKEIYWFTYIKFYINEKGCSIPLVVGKTGSLNVNTSCSDVSFSTDINHGPARKFLHDEQLDWDKTQILIIPCKSEKEAYQIENNIFNQFNLFYS